MSKNTHSIGTIATIAVLVAIVAAFATVSNTGQVDAQTICKPGQKPDGCIPPGHPQFRYCYTVGHKNPNPAGKPLPPFHQKCFTTSIQCFRAHSVDVRLHIAVNNCHRVQIRF